jgi:methylenetetrahydrofolate dehydrogenase (NADP+)/methenyltetrahydrofolate cyclohydrolase
MTAVPMPGGPVADAVFEDVARRVEKLASAGAPVGLATLLVGDDAPSARYIRMKQEKAAQLGIAAPHVHLPAGASQEEVEGAIRVFNEDPAVSGMLFQYPPPDHIDYDRALSRIDPDKDVDGLHPYNMGRLALSVPGPIPCTPAGIEALLAHYEIPVWAEHTRRADILSSAAGVPGIIGPEHVRPGAVVVGAGVRYRGKTILADVDESVAEVAGWITPRVGGVGPTTVAMLMRNTVEAAERAAARRA